MKYIVLLVMLVPMFLVGCELLEFVEIGIVSEPLIEDNNYECPEDRGLKGNGECCISPYGGRLLWSSA